MEKLAPETLSKDRCVIKKVLQKCYKQDPDDHEVLCGDG